MFSDLLRYTSRISSILDLIDYKVEHRFKASPTSSLLLSSEMPTVLYSVGTTNHTDKEFLISFILESVLYLCTYLIK